MANGGKQRTDLDGAEYDRKHLRLVDAEQVEHGPVAVQRVDEEEAQRVHGDVDAGGGELLLLAQVEEVGAHVLVGQ
jgi:hypothetical protein